MIPPSLTARTNCPLDGSEPCSGRDRYFVSTRRSNREIPSVVLIDITSVGCGRVGGGGGGGVAGEALDDGHEVGWVSVDDLRRDGVDDHRLSIIHDRINGLLTMVELVFGVERWFVFCDLVRVLADPERSRARALELHLPGARGGWQIWWIIHGGSGRVRVKVVVMVVVEGLVPVVDLVQRHVKVAKEVWEGSSLGSFQVSDDASFRPWVAQLMMLYHIWQNRNSGPWETDPECIPRLLLGKAFPSSVT
ncbi:hypothetical protein AKJ16_DCAP13886 [Drosera capensis]